MCSVLVLSVFFLQGILGDSIVRIQDGRINGTTIRTQSGRTFYGWRGIPYGQAPVGRLRFLAPVKAQAWAGIRDATRDSPACVNFLSFPTDPVPLYGTSEDCLYINVYSPVPVDASSSINPRRSVLVWIYGGGFSGGFSDFGFYDPAAFMEEDVIVVTFNYRLGSLGFLSTGDTVILGNAGLKDQNLALRWVRDNIAFFGGNPADVTLFGESAGGMSVGLHVVSPMSRNLFKGAILQSGTALLNMQQTDPRQYAHTLAWQVDPLSISATSTSQQILQVLQVAPLETLRQLTTGMLGPVLEVQSDQSFITESLYETLEFGNFARVPIIVGVTSEEQLGYGTDAGPYVQMAGIYDSFRQLLLPGNLKLQPFVNPNDIANKIHEHYVGTFGSFAANLGAYFRLSSDNFMVRSCTKHAVLQSKFTPVYMYEFSYYGTLSQGNIIVPGAGKVAHAQEVGYHFNISTAVIRTPQDFLTRRRFVKLWANFAKTSNPTPNDASAELLQYVKWLPISGNNMNYLDIDHNLELKPSHRLSDMYFWDSIWQSYSYRPYNSY